jgi:hypothetical protein
MARLDFVRLYTIESNIKAYGLGFVHEDSISNLKHQFYYVCGFGDDDFYGKADMSEDDYEENEEDENS